MLGQAHVSTMLILLLSVSLKVLSFSFWWFSQGIGNGVPIGAVVTTPEIAKVLTYRTYFNTFGGNPVSTASGLAVLRVIEKERLQENADVVGSYLKDRLTSLKEKHESTFPFSDHFLDSRKSENI